MEAKAQLQSYEQVEFSIKLTAPVTDWRAMMKQIEKMKGDSFMYGWPLSSLVGCIDKMLRDLDKTHADSVRAEDQALKTAEGKPE